MGSSATNDKIGGTVTRVRGRIKSRLARARGRRDLRSQAQVEQLRGAARQVRGVLKSKAR